MKDDPHSTARAVPITNLYLPLTIPSPLILLLNMQSMFRLEAQGKQNKYIAIVVISL